MAGRTLDFKSLTENDAMMAAGWFLNDAEGQAEFGGFYGSHPKWWRLVRDHRNRSGWTVWRNGEPIGFADLELCDDGSADLSVYVVPAHRGQGLATAMMRALGPIAGPLGVRRLRGAIRPDNAVSLRAATASGGVLIGKDEHGYQVVVGPPLHR